MSYDTPRVRRADAANEVYVVCRMSHAFALMMNVDAMRKPATLFLPMR